VKLFDSHVHLDAGAFAADRDAVIGRARAAGVMGLITVGTGLTSSRAAVELAAAYPEIYASVAIHPQDAAAITDQAMDELRTIAAHPKVVAIGETGLDYAHPDPPRDRQRDAFSRHIRLSRELQLPLIIHCRDAYDDVLAMLLEASVSSVVMHAFSGSKALAEACVARGYAISLAGPVTFRNAGASAEVGRAVPLEFLLVETDAPGLAPVPHRGRRNEPAYLIHTVTRIAALRGVPPEEVAQATTTSARRVFGVS